MKTAPDQPKTPSGDKAPAVYGSPQTEPPSPWWGERRLDEGQVGRWQVGPLSLWIEHQESEWLLTHEQKAEPFSTTLQVDWPCEHSRDPHHPVQRFAIQQKNNQVRLIPLCADRPVVTRPLNPFSITARETVTLFISTPIWLHLEVGTPPRTLIDIPTFRPSDTWFGPDTLQGELCYANRLPALFDRDKISWVPHRSITALEITNSTREPVLIERISLPLPHFSLFSGQDCHLWTEGASLELTGVDGLAQLRIHKEPPEDAGDVTRQSPARIPLPENLVFRALAALFPSGGSYI